MIFHPPVTTTLDHLRRLHQRYLNFDTPGSKPHCYCQKKLDNLVRFHNVGVYAQFSHYMRRWRTLRVHEDETPQGPGGG